MKTHRVAEVRLHSFLNGTGLRQSRQIEAAAILLSETVLPVASEQEAGLAQQQV